MKKLRKEEKIKEVRIQRYVTDVKVRKVEDGKIKAGSTAKFSLKRVDDESDQLEKSDLSEEHGQPTFSGSICHLSDCCTQSSKKRNRQDSSFNGSESERVTFRIRLPLGKHIEPDSSLSEQDKNGHSTGSATCAQEGTVLGNAQMNVELAQLKPSLDPALQFSGQERTDTRRSRETSSHINEIWRAESAYKTLTENWVPDPPMHQLWQNDFDDEDFFLASRKKQDKQESKRHKTNIEVSCSRSSGLWPQAEYLLDVGICALPYVVPF